jgi:hypothetical protein
MRKSYRVDAVAVPRDRQGWHARNLGTHVAQAAMERRQ